MSHHKEAGKLGATERLTDRERNRLDAEVGGDPMMLEDAAAAWLEAEDDLEAQAFADGQRCALDGMDLPDGAYMAMADEMGIDPLGDFDLDEAP